MIIGERDAALELVFDTDDQMIMFTTGLQYFINECHDTEKQQSIVHSKESNLRKLWNEVDVNGDSKLDIKEVEKLLVKLNFEVQKSLLKQKFKTYDKDNSGFIDFEEFKTLMNDLRMHEELTEIFNKYKQPKS